MFISPFELLSVDEEARLLTLSEYDILHSLREAAFDEIVRLSTHVFKTPISLIGLVGAGQVQYKAAEGLPDLFSQPRQAAICALLVRQNRAVVFTDLTQAAQYQQLTAAAYANAASQQFQFYAGVPLRVGGQHVGGQHVIGTLCIIDRRPRQLGLPEMHVLEQLAQLVERLIVVRHTCLGSAWLGEEAWRDIQAYVSAKLQVLTALTCRASQAPPTAAAAAAPGVLWLVVNELNALGTVLAEPLPGFA